LGKFISKNTNFGGLGPVSPHFKSDIGEIWHNSVDLGLSPHAKFGKTTNFGDFSTSEPTFLKPQP